MDAQENHALDRVRHAIGQASFCQALGIAVVGLGPGWVETRLTIRPDLGQAEGFVHAGVQATLADSTAGGAAATLMRADETVLTAEFKLHLLRPAKGETLFCRAEVVKPGKRLTVVEARVYAEVGDQRTHVALFLGTMAVIPASG